jgi:hypothetical protein
VTALGVHGRYLVLIESDRSSGGTATLRDLEDRTATLLRAQLENL